LTWVPLLLMVISSALSSSPSWIVVLIVIGARSWDHVCRYVCVKREMRCTRNYAVYDACERWIAV
jgi:hypothetical protein